MFEPWKDSCKRLAKQIGKLDLLPSDNLLYCYYENGSSPEDVVNSYCCLGVTGDDENGND